MTALAKPTMSPSLPPEMLDLVVNHLCDELTTFKTCCVISKLWVPLTRKHLFGHVDFDLDRSHIERWKKTFPDPPNSPTHHTRTLSVRSLFLTCAPSEIFLSRLSLPLLEDLALVHVIAENDTDGWDASLTSPKLTGSLELRTFWGVRHVVRRLLDRPNGIHFARITMACVDDAESITDLVSRCSDTPESLSVLRSSGVRSL